MPIDTCIVKTLDILANKYSATARQLSSLWLKNLARECCENGGTPEEAAYTILIESKARAIISSLQSEKVILTKEVIFEVRQALRNSETPEKILADQLAKWKERKVPPSKKPGGGGGRN